MWADIPHIPHKKVKGAIENLGRWEVELAEAAKVLDATAKDAQDVDEQDLAAAKAAEQAGRPKPERREPAVKRAADDARFEWEKAQRNKADAKAELDRVRQAHEDELLAVERKELEKLDLELAKALTAAKAVETARERVFMKMMWVKEGRVKGLPTRYLPVPRGEGGEDRVRADVLLDALLPGRNLERPAGQPVTRATEGVSTPGFIGKVLRNKDGVPLRPRGGVVGEGAVDEDAPPLWTIAT